MQSHAYNVGSNQGSNQGSSRAEAEICFASGHGVGDGADALKLRGLEKDSSRQAPKVSAYANAYTKKAMNECSERQSLENTENIKQTSKQLTPRLDQSNSTIEYSTGFGNHFSQEARPDALPKHQNNPQRCPYGLYAEQLSGTAFTAPRADNLYTWLYRIRPSVSQTGDFSPISLSAIQSKPSEGVVNPNQLRWSSPQSVVSSAVNASVKRGDFVESLFTVANNKAGAIHWYHCDQDMGRRFFTNADGEMMVIPQEGPVLVKTEMGLLEVGPKEFAVIPQGVVFQVNPIEGRSIGYVCENWKAPFSLPELGPIGANGLANRRDFQYPVAWYEDVQYEPEGAFGESSGELISLYQHETFSKPISHSPLDVVAWHGKDAPYKYNLAHFNTINTVSFDHPDPSIFTVMTSQSNNKGTANIDFVLFPPRWMVAEHTFRPPYFHRNVMGELMGLITGVYDAKEEGFKPGGISIHNPMTPHGPEVSVYEKASEAPLAPVKQQDTYAFMFESRYPWHPTQQALALETLDQDYKSCWSNFPKADLNNL